MVIADPAANKENTGLDAGPTLIPLRADAQETWVQGVKIRYNAFPFDLRFAITFHKVQGQTLDKVILFLHKRTTRQLAPLYWESLYVAYTRVKCASDIRVCYFGSDTSSDHKGLEHLRNLRRPQLYDIWQHGYDKEGKWNQDHLCAQAVKKRKKLRRKLRYVTSVGQATVKTLKEWADILDILVPCKPGTNKRLKTQYVQAIMPVWVGINGGVLTSGGNPTSLMSQKKTPDTRQTVCRKSSASNTRRHPRRKTTFTSTGDTTTTSPNPGTRRFAQPPTLTSRQVSRVAQAKTDLRVIRRQYTSRRHAKTHMGRTTYCMDLERVKECSQWAAFALATPGEFVGDTVIYYFTSHFCDAVNSRAYTIDPLLWQTRIQGFVKVGIDNKYLERLHTRRQCLLFPLNVPAGLHWVIVLVWLNSVDQLVIHCRNSMASLRHNDRRCCDRVRSYMQKLYRGADGSYTCPTFSPTPSLTVWTEQTPNVYACGLHVISHVYLASKGFAYTHTFDNDFVEQIRVYCVDEWYLKRCVRRTTNMSPLDLTVDDPRLKLLLLT